MSYAVPVATAAPAPKRRKKPGPKKGGVDICGGRTQGGTRCGKPPGWRTDHPGTGRCKFHGGMAPTHMKANVLPQLGLALNIGKEVETSPHDALLWLVRVAKAEVLYYSDQVAALREDQLVQHPESWEERPRSFGKDGESVTETVTVRKGGSPELHIFVRAREKAMDALARYSKMAISAGVEERAIALVERQAQELTDLLRLVLTDPRLGLSAKQETLLPDIVHGALKQLESTTNGREHVTAEYTHG